MVCRDKQRRGTVNTYDYLRGTIYTGDPGGIFASSMRSFFSNSGFAQTQVFEVGMRKKHNN